MLEDNIPLSNVTAKKRRNHRKKKENNELQLRLGSCVLTPEDKVDSMIN